MQSVYFESSLRPSDFSLRPLEMVERAAWYKPAGDFVYQVRVITADDLPTPQLWICQVFLACVMFFQRKVFPGLDQYGLERTLDDTARALEHSFSYVVKPQVHFSLSPTQWVISVDCLSRYRAQY